MPGHSESLGLVIERALNSQSLIVSGPLNDAYKVTIDGRPYFVRVRTYYGDSSFAQTFAAERIVYPLLPSMVRRPLLQQVGTLPSTSRQFAVFDWLEGASYSWTRSHAAQLTDALAVVHSVRGPGFGPIQRSSNDAASTASEFLRMLFEAEIELLRTYDNPNTLQSLVDWTEVFDAESPCLCHGDVYGANLLITEDDLLYLIDWEAARWRVAAADFNQVHVGWLSRRAQSFLIDRYAELTGRSPREFRRQVAVLQAFWHLRTANFTAVSDRVVFSLSPAEHLQRAAEILAYIK